MESELANRVGELVVEVEALNQTVDSQKEEVALAKERVQRAEQAMKSFKDRIESDYVSRQQVMLACNYSSTRVFSRHVPCGGVWQVTELESLYSESMQRLASRVESLEGVRRAGSSPAVSSGGASGGPPVDRSGARHSAGLPSVTSMASGGVGGLKPARVPIQASGGRGRGGAPPNVLTVGNAPGLAPIGRGKAASGLPAIPSSSARMVPGGSVPSPMAAWSVPVPAPVPVREEDLGMDMHDARALLSSILSGNRAV